MFNTANTTCQPQRNLLPGLKVGNFQIESQETELGKEQLVPLLSASSEGKDRFGAQSSSWKERKLNDARLTRNAQ